MTQKEDIAKHKKEQAVKYLESQYQIQTVTWFKLQYPRLKKSLIMINNGTATNAKTGARLKAMGMIAGACDLFLSKPSRGYPGMYLEMKTEKGIVSKLQREFMDEQEENGYLCKVAKSFDEAKIIISEYLIAKVS